MTGLHWRKLFVKLSQSLLSNVWVVELTDLNNMIELDFVQHVFTLISLIGLSVVCMCQKTDMNISMYLYLQIFCSNVKRVLEGTVQ